MNSPKMLGLSAIVLFATTLASPSDAHALDIIPTFDSSITSDPDAANIMTTINAACLEYKYRIADNVTVRITFVKDTTISLGQSLGGSYSRSYTSYRAALIYHVDTSFDWAVLATLPDTPGNPVNNNTQMSLKYPLARVLGLESPDQPGNMDGTIWLNTSKMKTHPDGDWVFDFGTFMYTKYSMYQTVCHEIDEILGFGSCLDSVKHEDPARDLDSSDAVLPEDLWRYDSSDNRSCTTDPSAVAFFKVYYPGHPVISIQFNQDSTGDFGDWFSDGSNPQVQSAFAIVHNINRLGAEMQVFDAIGYTILPAPVWLDFDEVDGANGDYYWAWNTEGDVASDIKVGGTVLIKGSPTLHHTRVDSNTFGKPVRVTSFNGTTRIEP